MGSISLADIGLWIVYFTLIFLVLWIYRNSKSEEHYRYFLRGFLIKVAGGLAFALVYVYYYKFGDTFLYHKGATVLSQTLIDNPSDYFRLLFSGHGNLPPDLSEFSQSISYSRTYEEWFMVKLLSPINLISFQSYLLSTLFMSLISFFGAWKLFLVFRDLLPDKARYAFWAVFLVPSVVFWGSGIMKDTITLFALNLLIYSLYFSVFKKSFKPWLIIVVMGMSYLIILLKAYILLAFLPGILLGFYVLVKGNIRNAAVRWVTGPLLFLAMILISYFGLGEITESSTKYSATNIEWQVKGFHSWHTDVGGSSYSLGDIEYTPLGVTQKIPSALNVTFFRPYLWEARNPVVFIGAIESLVFLLLFLTILYKMGFKFIAEIKKQPILYGAFIYCLIFGFAVGFTSYNFGALARYKIPILSLFAFILIFLNHRASVKRADKTQWSDPSSVLDRNIPKVSDEPSY